VSLKPPSDRSTADASTQPAALRAWAEAKPSVLCRRPGLVARSVSARDVPSTGEGGTGCAPPGIQAGPSVARARSHAQ
jgi:hypothetical protein